MSSQPHPAPPHPASSRPFPADHGRIAVNGSSIHDNEPMIDAESLDRRRRPARIRYALTTVDSGRTPTAVDRCVDV
jgi:hypothetical protein